MIERRTENNRAMLRKQRGFLLNPFLFSGGSVPDSDPYFSNVSLLLHMDGVDGSTVFADNSSAVRPVSAHGAAIISTAQSKYGGASGLFQGVNGTYISTPASDRFDFSGDFTIEFFLRIAATPGVAFGLMTRRSSTAFYSPFNIEVTNSRQIRAQVSLSGASWTTAVTAEVLSVNVWHHVAVGRSEGSLLVHADGVLSASADATARALMPSSDQVVIGAASPTEYALNGNMDELRITKGVCRYVSNFTPPSAPFPNS